ncbi:MAG: hypothetical protein ABIC91_06255 [Nanoarchaeota archaeon]|nr:hypothetical protein [Nanoarchaeota archaeon]MBU1030376.1 hypothetical protein [Nanoarchaeota archaeon]MBU1850283.1 hypothetical protein [Nanoarchaeota archaeon]
MGIPEHEHFYFVHGKKAETIIDFKNAIKDMSDKEFKHHVNKQKNDFAKWILEVLKEESLAKAISYCHSKEDVLKAIKEYELDLSFKYPLEQLEASEEFKRFLAKEFIYGMIFGLILGFILSRLLI